MQLTGDTKTRTISYNHDIDDSGVSGSMAATESGLPEIQETHRLERNGSEYFA